MIVMALVAKSWVLEFVRKVSKALETRLEGSEFGYQHQGKRKSS